MNTTSLELKLKTFYLISTSNSITVVFREIFIYLFKTGTWLDYLLNISPIFLLTEQLTTAVLEKPVWIIWWTIYLQYSFPGFLSQFCQYKNHIENKHVYSETSIIFLNKGKLQNFYIHNVTNSFCIDCLYISLVLIGSTCNLFEFWWHFGSKNVLITLLYDTFFFVYYLSNVLINLIYLFIHLENCGSGKFIFDSWPAMWHVPHMVEVYHHKTQAHIHCLHLINNSVIKPLLWEWNSLFGTFQIAFI